MHNALGAPGGGKQRSDVSWTLPCVTPLCFSPFLPHLSLDHCDGPQGPGGRSLPALVSIPCSPRFASPQTKLSCPHSPANEGYELHVLFH